MRYAGQATPKANSGYWYVEYSSLTGASIYAGLPIDVGFTLEFLLAFVPGVDIPGWAALPLSAISVAPWAYSLTHAVSSESFGAETAGGYIVNITGDLNVSYLYNYSEAFRLLPSVVYGTALNVS